MAEVPSDTLKFRRRISQPSDLDAALIHCLVKEARMLKRWWQRVTLYPEPGFWRGLWIRLRR